jgi:hypothetical protein
MPIFCRKLGKIAENCDHNIDPRGWKKSSTTFSSTHFKTQLTLRQPAYVRDFSKRVNVLGSHQTLNAWQFKWYNVISSTRKLVDRKFVDPQTRRPKVRRPEHSSTL